MRRTFNRASLSPLEDLEVVCILCHIKYLLTRRWPLVIMSVQLAQAYVSAPTAYDSCDDIKRG